MINNKNKSNQLLSQLNSKKLRIKVYNSLENMSILTILKMSGYIKILNIDHKKKIIEIEKLKINAQYKSISKPGRKIYINQSLSKVKYKQGLGETLIRTSNKGIIKNTGQSSGEVLLTVF